MCVFDTPHEQQWLRDNEWQTVVEDVPVREIILVSEEQKNRQDYQQIIHYSQPENHSSYTTTITLAQSSIDKNSINEFEKEKHKHC